MEYVSFVILHYKDYSVTDTCVQSILAMEQQERIRIVVVDNDIQKNQKSYEEKKENLNRAKNSVLSRNEKKYNGTNGKGTTGWQGQYKNQYRPNPAMVPEIQEQQKMPQQKPQTEEALMKTATANTVLPKTALSKTEMPDELLKLTGDAEKY